MRTTDPKWSSVDDLVSEDIFDSRDVEEAINFYESKAQDAIDEPDENEPLDEEEAALLAAMIEVRDACGSEWRHGVGYVRESHWKDYCEEYAGDVGLIEQMTGGDSNPLAQCIDWEAWADLMAHDYSTVEIDGATFYYRD